MRPYLAQSFSPVITAIADNRPLFRAAVHWLAAEAVCTHADARGHSTHAAGALTRVDRERARETERGEREAERVEQRERESVCVCVRARARVAKRQSVRERERERAEWHRETDWRLCVVSEMAAASGRLALKARSAVSAGDIERYMQRATLLYSRRLGVCC